MWQMENWKKDARRDLVMVDIDALVPKDHLLRKIEKPLQITSRYRTQEVLPVLHQQPPREKPERRRAPYIRRCDLRHTAASVMLQNGMDVRTRSVMPVHADAGLTLRTCTHTTTRQQAETANLMGSLMAQQSEPRKRREASGK